MRLIVTTCRHPEDTPFADENELLGCDKDSDSQGLPETTALRISIDGNLDEDCVFIRPVRAFTIFLITIDRRAQGDGLRELLALRVLIILRRFILVWHRRILGQRRSKLYTGNTF